jgi:predicted ester cyclase
MTNDLKCLIRQRRRFPDLRMDNHDIVAEGDKVVTRVIGQGTQRGEWLGIVPTGAVIRLKGINMDRIRDKRIVEQRGEADAVGMLARMGVDALAGSRVLNIRPEGEDS